MFDRSNKERQSPGTRLFIILLCAAVVFVSTTRAAENEQRRSRSRQRRPRQGRSQDRAADSAREAEEAFGDLDDQLKEMLELVNQGKRLQSDQIVANTGILKQNRKRFKDKSFKKDNKEMACEIFMLQGWNDYFDGKLDKALKAMTIAYKTDRTNNDARLSQGGLAIAAGQKPIKLPTEKEKKTEPARTTDNRRQRPGRTGPGTGPGQMGPMGPGFMGPGMGPMGPGFMGPGGGGFGARGATRGRSNISSGDILEFDLNDINDDLIGRTVSPLQLNCLNATDFSYQPGRDVLCAVFWKLGLRSAAAGDPNDAAQKRTESRRRGRRQSSQPRNQQPGFMGPMGPGFMGPMGPAFTGGPGTTAWQAEPSDPLAVQMQAYSDLFGSKFTDKSVKFVAVNLDGPEHKPAVMKRLLKSPWPMAHVMGKDPENVSGEILPGQLEDIDKTKQTLIITEKNGTVRYAGPAKGFVPVIVLDSLVLADSGVESPVPSRSVPAKKKTTQVEDEEKAQRPGPSGRKKASEELEDIDPQASKLLENAKAFMKIGTRFTTPKQGVELCRQIIREYPDTTYASQARELLRGLPERHQRRYKITDEEMGL